jgi:hypothetical protein
MQQRCEHRFAANQAVWVTLLDKAKTRIQGRVRNISSRGIGIGIGQAIATGTPLQIDVSDDMLLGEAIFCRQEGDHYFVGVELEHALYGLAELARALREFDETPCPERATDSSRS